MIHSVSFKYALMSHSISIIHRYIEIGRIVWLYVSAIFFHVSSAAATSIFTFLSCRIFSMLHNQHFPLDGNHYKHNQIQMKSHFHGFTHTRWQLRTHAKTHVYMHSKPKSAPSMPQNNTSTNTTMFQTLPLAFLTLTSMCGHSIELWKCVWSIAIHSINIKFPFSMETIMFPSISVHHHLYECTCT